MKLPTVAKNKNTNTVVRKPQHTICRSEGLSLPRFGKRITNLQFVERSPAGAVPALRACRLQIWAARQQKRSEN